MPDLFNGDPVPENAREIGFDLPSWSAKHGSEVVKEIIDSVIGALKENGVSRFATTAYCFGAPAAFYLAYARISHVTVVAHPSRLNIPADLEVSPHVLTNGTDVNCASMTAVTDAEISRSRKGSTSYQ